MPWLTWEVPGAVIEAIFLNTPDGADFEGDLLCGSVLTSFRSDK